MLKRIALLGLGGIALLVASVVGLAWGLNLNPPPLQTLSPSCIEAEPLRRGQPFEIISWNLQFGASRKHHFFYDGGDVVSVPEEDVNQTISAIKQVLQEHTPAIALLQELERGSRRTHHIDQMPLLNQGWGCSVSAPYHQSTFVPFPSHEMMGKVDMHLGILSQAPMSAAKRIQLALMDEPWIRQQFNLKRAMLTAEIPIDGHTEPLAVAVTHLSAFSHGDGTLEKQVQALRDWMDSHPPDRPWVLAGDFNLLPPGDTPTRLTAEGSLYADASNPMDALYATYTEAFSDPLSEQARTYLPFGASEPDRKIDYVFVGGPITVLESEVLHSASAVSDHLPLRVRLEVNPTLR